MLFEKELRKLLLETIERRKDDLSFGHALDYQKEVGIITGLRTALDLCDEANKLLSNT
jgi:hypothetical protein